MVRKWDKMGKVNLKTPNLTYNKCKIVLASPKITKTNRNYIFSIFLKNLIGFMITLLNEMKEKNLKKSPLYKPLYVMILSMQLRQQWYFSEKNVWSKSVIAFCDFLSFWPLVVMFFEICIKFRIIWYATCLCLEKVGIWLFRGGFVIQTP